MSRGYSAGDACLALWEDGHYYNAVVKEVNAEEDVYLVAYADSDLEEYVYASSLKEKTAKNSLKNAKICEKTSLASSVKTSVKGGKRTRRLTLKPQMREVVKILENENQFIRHIAMLEEFFVAPIKKLNSVAATAGAGEFCSDEIFEILFGRIEPIKLMSEKLLIDLEFKFDTCASIDEGDVPLVGEVFVEFVPFFKLYIDYITQYEKRVVPALKRLLSGRGGKKTSIKFRNFIRSVESRPEVELPFERLLALPCQRIGVYKDMVAELLKATPRGSADYASLVRALKTLGEVKASVESSLSTRANLDVIVQIEKKFIGNPGFSRPGRCIIRDGVLCKKAREITGKDREYRFYLFNDLLAYASSIGWKMKLHGKVDIDVSFSVRKLAPERDEHRLLVCSTTKSFVVFTRDAASLDRWYDAIVRCREEVRKSIPEQMRTVPPPVAPLPFWLPYSSVPRAEDIFPTGTTSGGFGANPQAQLQGKHGKASKGPTKEKIAHQITPTVTTIAKGSKSGPIQANISDINKIKPQPIPPAFRARHQQQQQQKPRLVSTSTAAAAASSTSGGAGGDGARFCPMCGSKRKDNWKFCDQCGHGF